VTEDEAREVLDAYRRARPRVLPAAVALVEAGVSQARVARLSGLTPAAVSVMLSRHRRRVARLAAANPHPGV
jgi:predicted transcriptional regulator